MNQPGVAVEIEDHRPIRGEQAVEIPIANSMGMFLWTRECKELHHIQHAYAEPRDLPLQNLHGRQGFLGGDVARAGHHHIGLIHLAALIIIAGPAPQSNALLHMPPRLFQREVLEVLLFI